MPLSDEQIQALLAGSIRKANSPRTGGGKGQPAKPSNLPRPQQIGPMRLFDKGSRCVSRNCGSPANIKIEGVGWQCLNHALYSLNKMVVDLTKGEDYLTACTCKPGMYSKGHTHILGCALYVLDMEEASAHL